MPARHWKQYSLSCLCLEARRGAERRDGLFLAVIFYCPRGGRLLTLGLAVAGDGVMRKVTP